MLRMVFQYCTTTRTRHLFDDDPAKAGERLVEIEPPPASYFTDALAPTTHVKPASVKGVWLPSPLIRDGADIDNPKVVIHFPGGAFVMTFGHQAAGKPVSELFVEHLATNKVLWAQYRLAADETTCFPAAVQDALTYYHYVLSLGIRPGNIILSGDSAGGNVVLGLMRYLETQQRSTQDPKPLPLPGAAIVFSPWVHVTSKAGEDYKACSNAGTDILTGSLLQWGADSYLATSERPVEAYVSPLHHPFQTSIPLYIHAGAIEAFFKSISNFAEEMKQMEGNRVRFFATAKGPHDLLLCHSPFGMTPELRAALDDARHFFEDSI